MPLPIAYDIALRWTRIAWVFVVAAGVLAVGVPLLPAPASPTIDLTPPADPGVPSSQTPDRPDPGAFEDVAWIELDAVMSRVHAVERAADIADAGDPTRPGGVADAGENAQGQPDDDEQQGLPGWRYVGDVELGGRLVAVLSISGAQVFLDEGAEVQGFTVAEVTPTHVVAEGRNGRFRIEREQSQAPAASLRSAPRGAMQSQPNTGDARRVRDERLRMPDQERERR